MTRYLFIALIAVLTLNTGCKLIYKQNVQQGNAHEQEDLDQIQLGMSKKQVAYLLGTPAVQDPFHQDRWDYISMLSRRGGQPLRRLVTLIMDTKKRGGSKLGVTGGPLVCSDQQPRASASPCGSATLTHSAEWRRGPTTLGMRSTNSMHSPW